MAKANKNLYNPNDPPPDGLTSTGIQDDESFHQVRVCAKVGRVYVFETLLAREALYRTLTEVAYAYTGPMLTGFGRKMPVKKIPDLLSYQIPADLVYHMLSVEKSKSTSDKARAAEYVVDTMMKLGKIVIPTLMLAVSNRKAQLAGIDYVADPTKNAQVKCDWPGGEWERGGTGYFFFQTAERNPKKQY
jgi:hypothetical protein